MSVIGDGDSAVIVTIPQAVPYGIFVSKIHCANHFHVPEIFVKMPFVTYGLKEFFSLYIIMIKWRHNLFLHNRTELC